MVSAETFNFITVCAEVVSSELCFRFFFFWDPLNCYFPCYRCFGVLLMRKIWCLHLLFSSSDINRSGLVFVPTPYYFIPFLNYQRNPFFFFAIVVDCLLWYWRTNLGYVYFSPILVLSITLIACYTRIDYMIFVIVTYNVPEKVE